MKPGKMLKRAADYSAPRNVRRVNRTSADRMRAGLCQPVMAEAIQPNESGTLSQTITFELDPVMGRLHTPVFAEMFAVFVPIEACYQLFHPDDPTAGVTEIARMRFLQGTNMFGMIPENDMTKRMGIKPRSINGQRMVCSVSLAAMNAAINFMRLQKYSKAPVRTWDAAGAIRALIGDTILDRLNAVLDPDDRINGQVSLDLPDMQLPVNGIGVHTNPAISTNISVRETGQTAPVTFARAVSPATAQNAYLEVNANNVPTIYAEFNGAIGGNLSLADFYRAETMDRLTRVMAQVLEAHPERGQEAILRWVHGLATNVADQPFYLARQTVKFGSSLQGAVDSAGIEGDVLRTDLVAQTRFTVPIPRTELGGIVVTFATVKPDETLADMPHPILSAPWAPQNFAADEMKIEPQPVLVRDLNSECLAADETQVVAWAGLNELKRNYVDYGFSRRLNPTTVEAKNSIWQLEIPVSVDAGNIFYPPNFPQYPFVDQAAEVVFMQTNSIAIIQTPTVFGPTPVEKLEIVDAQDLFDQV